MQINYDSRLINFVHQVKILSSMGFKMAPQIVQNSKTAQEFMEQAKDLEKVLPRITLITITMLTINSVLYTAYGCFRFIFLSVEDCEFSQQHW